MSRASHPVYIDLSTLAARRIDPARPLSVSIPGGTDCSLRCYPRHSFRHPDSSPCRYFRRAYTIARNLHRHRCVQVDSSTPSAGESCSIVLPNLSSSPAPRPFGFISPLCLAPPPTQRPYTASLARTSLNGTRTDPHFRSLNYDLVQNVFCVKHRHLFRSVSLHLSRHILSLRRDTL